MLRSLAIRNFTIIDELELDFAPGFSAITGETGAGKSILIDALAQLLGDRADAGLVAEGSKRADLGARFELGPRHPARRWLIEQALDDDDDDQANDDEAASTLLLRRVLPADGASRAWINGQPATIGQLREIGLRLVEIHGQHEHQRLTGATFQREWLDRQVDVGLLGKIARATERHVECKRALAEVADRAGDARDHELLRFQLEELDKLALEDDEFEQLERDHRRLASIEELELGYARALESLDGSQSDGAAILIHRAAQSLAPLVDREPGLSELIDMLATARVNLEEAASSLERLNESLEREPARLDQVERRLSRAIELARKHHVEPAGLPDFHARLRQQVERIGHFDADRTEAEQRLAEAESQWREQAKALNKARRKAAKTLTGQVEDALRALGMSEAGIRILIEHDDRAAVSRHGADRIEILFSANPGQSPKPLKRVASGGELSRLSLALIIASSEPASGLVRIFDEIDAGVGGETAHAVGHFLKKASEGGQALCVTHLAQVAASADAQIAVRKHPGRGRTRIDAQTLSERQRVGELARMLGSSNSEEALQHASALLSRQD